MKFTDPKGRTLEVNSPDGSIPTEPELDQMFSMKYGKVPTKDTRAVQTFPEQRQDRFKIKGSQPYDSYSYVDALSDTAKTAINSVANLGENITQPIFHPIKTVKSVASAVRHPLKTAQGLGGYIGERYGSVEKLASTVSTDPFGYGSDVVAGTTLAKPVVRVIKKAALGTPKAINTMASPIRDYAGNKVTNIRSGMKKNWKDETTAFGKTIDEINDVKGAVTGENLIPNLTQEMISRKLYDPLTEKWVKPLTKVDSQLIKSYTALGRELNKNGKINVNTILEEYRNIRDSSSIDTSLGRQARNIANKMITDISNEIDIPKLKQANARYSKFRTDFDAIDSKLDIWGNKIKTGKGEKFLMNDIGGTMENRIIANKIKEVTGISLKGAKAVSAIKNIPGVPLLLRR